MKIIVSFLFVFLSLNAFAQNVGVGNTNPIMKLHVRSPADSALLLLDNNTFHNTGVNVGAYFKSSALYTGAIKTTGTSSNAT
jgi:hypothetical protein